MKVIHYFTKFPAKYQPYNQKLISRLEEHIDYQIVLVNTINKTESLTLDIKEVYSWKKNIWKYLIPIVFSITDIIKFYKFYKINFLRALKLICRFYPIYQNRDGILHIHHLLLVKEELLKLLIFFNIKWGISLRGYDISIYPLLNKENETFVIKILNNANFIHSVSDSLLKRAIQLGADKKKTKLIYRATEETHILNRNLILKKSPILITTICRYNWKKGLVFGIQSIKKLYDMGFDIEYYIIGDGDEKERSQLYYWRYLLGLKHIIHFTGFLNSKEIDQYLIKTHIYLQPSINEGIPNTLKKVVYNGIPVVASEVDGIPELINDTSLGLLVPPGSPIAIANAIKKIWYNYDHYGKLYHTNTTVKEEIQNYIDMYNNIYLYANPINIRFHPLFQNFYSIYWQKILFTFVFNVTGCCRRSL